MSKEASAREARLYQLAQSDLAYQVWYKSFKSCQATYEEFFYAQPDAIQNILSGYADCGRVAQQRLLNLACEYMRFPDEE